MNLHDQTNSAAGPSAAAALRKRPALSTDGIARRRLFQGGVAGAGILLSSPARSALNLTGCESPSAAFSGNLSRPVGGPESCGSSTGGRSPGYWAQPQHFPSWADPSWVPSFPLGTDYCKWTSADVKKLVPSDVTGGLTVMTAFGFEPNFNDASIVPPAGGVPLWTVIAMHSLFEANNNGNYLFHLAAMYLNAAKFTSGTQIYPMTTAHVRQFAQVLFVGGEFCPEGATCGGSKPAWTQVEVKQYIDYWAGRYDDNSELPNLCKKNANP